jgi:hypothetical protein
MQERVTKLSATESSQSAYSAAFLTPFVDMFLLLLIGFVGISDGLRVILTKTDTVGSASAGGWIVLLGGLLIAGTIKLSIKEIRSERNTAAAAPDVDNQFWLPVIALAMLLIYIALIEPLGYTLATALFMAVYLRVFGKYGVLAIAAISLPFAFGSSWLWAAMDMMLPQGIMPWP